ncbi:MAG: M50 family metallopeptidase [Actinomycetales bacterium]
MTWIQGVVERSAPTGQMVGADAWLWWVVAALALAAVGPLWRRLRLVVTLVHELGHAGVGVALGRRFDGFVLNADASGHAVTTGPARGPALVATTWAGYPAPGLLGALMVVMAVRGWAAPLITGALLVLLVVLIRVRSLLTLAVTGSALVAVGALWWWRDDAVQAGAVGVVGATLLVGAWRHLAAAARARTAGSDAARLAHLTGVPATVWTMTFAAALAGATWVALASVWPGARVSAWLGT